MQANPILEEQTKDLAEVINSISRRRTAIMIIAIALFIISALVAALLPSVYRSSATILIEEQGISTDLVRAAVSTFAVQRIQTISQLVMTRSNLQSIINKYNLYSNRKRTKTEEEIIADMREDIHLDMVDADVIDPRSGAPGRATIAFTLAFDGDNPEITQKVSTDLTSLFLKMNIQNRTSKAEESYSFLKEEADSFEKQIAVAEKNLSDFKEKNADALPDLSGVTPGILDLTKREIDTAENQMRIAHDRIGFLESQLIMLSPSGPSYSSSGQVIPDVGMRLKALKSEYATASANYSPNHPDVVRLRREIAAMEGKSGAVDSSVEQGKQLEILRSNLASAQRQYSDDHPDVIKLKKQIAALENTPATTKPVMSVAPVHADNPAYLSVQAQLNSAKSDYEAQKRQRDDLKANLIEYQAKIAKLPRLEAQYSDLSRGLEIAKAKYMEIKGRQHEAELSQHLEQESKGERFTLIEPPAFPERPISPNRPVIIALGAVLSLAAGLAFAILMDAMDKSVRGPNAVAAVLGVLPLGSIPYMENSVDRSRKLREKRLWLMFLATCAVTVLLLINYLWMPLDILTIKASRLIGGYMSEMFGSTP